MLGSEAASSPFHAFLNPSARDAPPSGIVEVFQYGFGRPGLIPLWAGEGDLSTPAFITDAAAASLAKGETFYTLQRGIPELREALARYHARLYGRAFASDRFLITGSGMHAILIAVQATVGVGNEVVVPTPAWPNLAAAVRVAGGTPRFVPLAIVDGRWRLDLDRVFAAIGPKTRAIFINSPANPTGWTATLDELAAILEVARRHGLWIIADEVYARFVFDGRERAPSFYDLMEADDRVLFVNTFSKNWAMTGWRVGWIAAPPALGDAIENLIQYSTSGVATFMQRAATVALDEGEPFVAEQVGRAAAARRALLDALSGSNRFTYAEPEGAFYLLFGVAGETDTRALALRLVDEAGIGLAPGTAFGPGGENYLRLCFGRDPATVAEAARRLADWTRSH